MKICDKLFVNCFNNYMMQSLKIHASGVILIGGKSSRFGNDKALMMVDGETSSQWVFVLIHIVLQNNSKKDEKLKISC